MHVKYISAAIAARSPAHVVCVVPVTIKAVDEMSAKARTSAAHDILGDGPTVCGLVTNQLHMPSTRGLVQCIVLALPEVSRAYLWPGLLLTGSRYNAQHTYRQQ